LDQQSSERNQQIRKVRQWFGGVCFFLIAGSQIVLFTTPINDKVIVPRGLLFGVLGAVLLLLSQVLPVPKLMLRVKLFTRPPAWMRIIAAVIFALLTTYATVRFQRFGRVNYMPVLSLWAISALFYLSAFRLPDIPKARILAWFKANRFEWIALLGITLLAAALRLYRLGSIPRVINGDEGMIGMVAQSTVSGNLSNPFALYQNMGGLYLQALNLSITLFHPNAFSIRLPSAIGGILSVLISYVLGRKIFGKRVGLLAAALIAMSHTHLNFSRTLTGYIQETWLIPLEVLLLLNGLENRRSWQTALSGMLLAVHFSYYLTAPPMVAIMLGYMILCLIFHRQWFRSVLPQVAAYWGGLAILVLPSLYRYLETPAELLARLTLEGTFQSGWLAATAADTGQSGAQILLGRITHAFLSLIYYPSLDFYGSTVPMLSMTTSVLFFIGLVFALIKIRHRPTMFLLTVLFGFIAFIGIFAIPPAADSYRVVVILPFAMILAALGIDTLFHLLDLSWPKYRVRYLSVSGILLVLLFLTNMQIYFGDFAGRCQFGGDQVSRFASYLGSYVGTFDRSTNVNLLSDDLFFYGSHPSVDFLSESHPITNIYEAVDGQTFPSGDLIIAPPSRIAELKTWMDAHPGGTAQYLYDCKITILLGYQLP